MTSIPLETVRNAEWWTGNDAYNLGIHRFDEETVFARIEGAGRWKFAIDECLVASGRSHSAMPPVRATRVKLASRTLLQATGAPFPEPSGDGSRPAATPFGDHLPAEVDLALGDGSLRALSKTWEPSALPLRPASDGVPSLRIPLADVRAIRWSAEAEGVALHLDYRDGAKATLDLTHDGAVTLDAQ